MIGIIGFGRFGRLAARYLAKEFDVKVLFRQPRRQSEIIASGANPADLPSVCAQPVVLLCVPISALQETLALIAPLLTPKSVVVDVCSVKLYPVKWMEALLPPNIQILATHPMFGPDSAANSLAGHKIVLCPVRIRPAAYRRITRWLTRQELVVMEATPDEHDRQAAVSLGLTHFIGRGLARLGTPALSIDTATYRRLKEVQTVVTNDAFELFEDMHRYNPHAREQREALIEALAELHRELLSKL
jgi:prephenate dehydrogenase